MLVISTVIAVLGAIFALIGLGLIVGFSPVLYVTHLTVLSKATRPIRQSVILLSGVASAVVLLVALSNFIQPDTLREVTRSTLITLTTTHWFDFTAGALFIIGGLYYLFNLHKEPSKVRKAKKHTIGANSGLYAIGLFKTMGSLSGFAALLFSVRFIHEVSVNILVEILLFIVLLIATILPFVGLLLVRLYHPQTFKGIQRLITKMTAYNYRTYVGVVLVAIGGLFVIFGFFF